ncbi:hypothetical protein Syun_008690 [Stephania yunnanensis]|uniref:Uncharacterized protein n=1 Tax=Stephania yunnanensis TaxID=152371 RepID=A0AAP0KD13_9MAGN
MANHQDAQHVPHFLPTQLIDELLRGTIQGKEKRVVRRGDLKSLKTRNYKVSQEVKSATDMHEEPFSSIQGINAKNQPLQEIPALKRVKT